MRTKRHHRVCDIIANSLREKAWTVFREDQNTNTNGDVRISDLVCINNTMSTGLILDPTIRWEKNLEQADEVNAEKRNHYLDTIPNYKLRFPQIRSWDVIGLLFGARGTIPKFTADILLKNLKISNSTMHEIIIGVVKDSCTILHNHLYSKT